MNKLQPGKLYKLKKDIWTWLRDIEGEPPYFNRIEGGDPFLVVKFIRTKKTDGTIDIYQILFHEQISYITVNHTKYSLIEEL
jgi:hypothetical protein